MIKKCSREIGKYCLKIRERERTSWFSFQSLFDYSLRLEIISPFKHLLFIFPIIFDFMQTEISNHYIQFSITKVHERTQMTRELLSLFNASFHILTRDNIITDLS